MLKSAHFFAGANTADGFTNYFGDIVYMKNCTHMYYIKGGPGVGKSTFMKRMGEIYEKDDAEIVYYHCSSDPDSLDGVIFKAANAQIGMIDATAPHTFDPLIPGAHDTLVSLGDCLNEKRMHTYAPFLYSLNDEISKSFQRCYANLRAAGALYDIENKEYTKFENWNKSEVKKFVQGLLEEVFDFPKKRSEAAWGSVRNCFLEAYTHRGLISYSDQLPRENCMVFDCPTDGHLSGFLEYLKNQLVEAGIDVIALHHPLCAGYLSHLYCPEQGLLLTGDQSLGSVTEVGDLLNHNHYRQYHKGLHEHAICQKLIEGAIHQLKHAKMMHDELEAVYIEHMDFNKWEEKFRETLASI